MSEKHTLKVGKKVKAPKGFKPVCHAHCGVPIFLESGGKMTRLSRKILEKPHVLRFFAAVVKAMFEFSKAVEKPEVLRPKTKPASIEEKTPKQTVAVKDQKPKKRTDGSGRLTFKKGRHNQQRRKKRIKAKLKRNRK